MDQIRGDAFYDYSQRAERKVPWADLVFLSEAEHEQFCNLTIITLKSHYDNVVYDLVFEQLDRLVFDTDPYFKAATDLAHKTMDEGQVQVRQFVEYNGKDDLTICLNVEQIDDKSIIEILSFVSDFVRTYDGILPIGVTEFGNTFSFTTKELKPHAKGGIIGTN